MGYGIYKRIGFMDQNTHNRLYMADNFRTALSVFSRSELDEAKGLAGIAERKLLAHTDRLSFGADRTSILANRAIFPYGYILPQMALLMPVKPSEGLLCKEGAMSLQIGPIYAHNEHSLRILLAALCLNAPESLMKGVQVYIPDTAPSYSSTTFISLGFVECVGRECRPMRLPVDPSCNITLPAPFCCATAGPDLG
ncbi:hypothetical protein Pelo_4001 [Pelomyxa schiedti]|nr:hypothetical protein Pelo_4001 [Pelomyxa schiedti]